MFYKGPISETQPLRVVFEGDSIENGIDGGGPGFFEGNAPSLLPVMRGPALRLRHFKLIGSIIAHSIINGGRGKQCNSTISKLYYVGYWYL